ncbi:hypothetical protein B0H67DRAFT_549101 [Lasiosphaeris hirsuta]|uniref:SprT-like domain-containing protein n=1 Tax=Lasiosphaeris hirsuta TaxID=260670 RepID=A0AA40E7N9_9PEZI|nr:hypothetical protein B0H67DRAFT_549101 [Lasiosphaeris hirsuta]
MARLFAGGDEHPPIRLSGGHHHPFVAKRRTIDLDDGSPRQKRPNPTSGPPRLTHNPSPGPGPHPRMHSSRPPSPESAPPMERTISGHSIRAEPTERSASTELLEDEEAAQRVRDHLANFRRRFPDSKHERILRSIINPRSNAEYPLDNDSLESIFSAANEIFFNGRLSKRVMWDWSHESSTQYDSSVIGTTALRRASTRGFETLIVLSSPILRDTKYSRRLLISTFLHELVHSYLFIVRGFRARYCGGHTPAFRTIAKMIDDWAGSDSALYLGKMEADLERFRIRRHEEGEPPLDYDDDRNYPVFYPCSGVSEQQAYQHQAGGGAPVGGPGHHDSYNGRSSPGHRRQQAVRPQDFGDDSGSPYVYTNTLLQRP